MNDKKWEERRFPQKPREGDFRTEYQRDHARLVHSAAFRRLQAKTQILGLGEGDFYRTRLTHSMEVAQIGTSINFDLYNRYKSDLDESLIAKRALMNTICLAHDIGHPPFGHGGEVALNYCMREHGGFEGNGQTLRILSKLGKYTENYGLNPTRRTLLGVLKYPANYSELVKEDTYGEEVKDKPNWLFKSKQQKPPKCYFDCDKDVVDWVLAPLNSADKSLFTQIETNQEKHAKTQYKSLDTSIMELADDISYGVHDLEDAIALKIIDQAKWEKYVDESLLGACGFEAGEIKENLFSKESYIRKGQIGELINLFITKVEIEEVENSFSEPLLKYNAVHKQSEKNLLEHLQDLVRDHVIKNSNVQQLEIKGQKIVAELFEVFATDPERLLPESVKDNYLNDGNDIRTVCDFIAGMTDEYATRLYEKIFYPRKGSIFEVL